MELSLWPVATASGSDNHSESNKPLFRRRLRLASANIALPLTRKRSTTHETRSAFSLTLILRRKTPKPSGLALASWTDSSHHALAVLAAESKRRLLNRIANLYYIITGLLWHVMRTVAAFYAVTRPDQNSLNYRTVSVAIGYCHSSRVGDCPRFSTR